jgi:ApbE superfamily uncharacterized protein (UPF0280 family)
MTAPQRQALGGGRWHFQHGPIDCVLGADGPPAALDPAFERAWQRFGGVLAELVAELPLLRCDLASPAGRGVMPQGRIAQRMVAACRPHAGASSHAHAAAPAQASSQGGRYISAMAAVAGSVAEELLACFDDPRIVRAHVNNGGDIALKLMPGTSWRVGLVGHVDAPRLDAGLRIDAASAVRGIATSGWRGRSLSRGIADSVTVFAATAGRADAAATVIANAVDIDAAGIVRLPANRVRDDSDLGDRLVTRHVPALPAPLVAAALAHGAAEAERAIAAGHIAAAALHLQGRMRLVGPLFARAADARTAGFRIAALQGA